MSDRPFVDGPELVPPAELLELRAHLAVAPRAETRRAHLDAIVAQVRDHRRTAWGRAASTAARGAAAVVVTLTVTTGLAAADVLPDSAQKVFTSVSDRFGGGDGTPTSDPADDISLTTTETTTRQADRETRATTSTTGPSTTSTSTTVPEPVVTTTTTSTTQPPTTTTVPPTTTTAPVAGPTDPGSPGGVEDPEEPAEPVEEPPEETADPNEPTEPDSPAVPVDEPTDPAPTDDEGSSEPSITTKSGVRAASDDGTGDAGQDGGPG